MSVIAQLPPDMGGASGKVSKCTSSIRLSTLQNVTIEVAYIDTEGTFRPDRIRAIAERFGVNGDMALENILYGKSRSETQPTPYFDISMQRGHSIANIRQVARYLLGCYSPSLNIDRWNSSTSVPCVSRKTRTLDLLYVLRDALYPSCADPSVCTDSGQYHGLLPHGLHWKRGAQ